MKDLNAWKLFYDYAPDTKITEKELIENRWNVQLDYKKYAPFTDILFLHNALVRIYLGLSVYETVLNIIQKLLYWRISKLTNS